MGRTARAGRPGTACTIAADADRKVIRAVVRAARSTQPDAVIKGRTLPVDEVEAWHARLQGLEAEVDAVLLEEKEARATDVAERELQRGENLVRYEGEIASRPRRTWFTSQKGKEQAKERGKQKLNEGQAVMKDALEEIRDGKATNKKVTKLSGKAKKKLLDGDIRRDGKMWKKGKADRGASVKKGEKRKKHPKTENKR